MSLNNTLHVKVISPFKLYYEGQAVSVSGENSKGKFDILYGHISFISWLSKCDLIIDKGEGKKEERTITFPVAEGVVTVTTNQVYVFII